MLPDRYARPMGSSSRRIAAACAVGIGVAGCQVFLSLDKTQCSTDAECASKVGPGAVCQSNVCKAPVTADASDLDAGSDAAQDTGPADPWACLANPPPAPSEDRSKVITLRVRFLVYSLYDCFQNTPVPGALVKLCSQRDIGCTVPVETTTTDCDGYANLKSAYVGFQGYYLVAPPTPAAVDGGTGDWPAVTKQCFTDLAARQKAQGKDGDRCAVQHGDAGDIVVPMPPDLMNSINMITPPPAAGSAPDAAIDEVSAPHIFSQNTIGLLLNSVGQPLQPSAGHVFGLATDCNDQPAAGVTVDVAGGVTANSVVYYTDSQGSPSVNQGQTSQRGETGYVNLDPGPGGVTTVSVTATRKKTGQVIGVYGSLIRSGYITLQPFPPIKSQ